MLNNLVGNRIRELRAQRKLTQQQLADLAKIPRATLATIEKDESNPSLAAVYKIAVALNCTIDELLETQLNRVEVTTRDQMVESQSVDGVYHAVTLFPPNSGFFSQQRFTLEGRSSYKGKPHPPGSEEYLFIQEGEVILEVAGHENHLHAGDTAHFRGNVKHAYTNPGDIACLGMVTILEFPEIV